MMGAVGAYLASQQAIRAGSLKLVTTHVAVSLQHFRPAAIARTGRVPRLLADANNSVLPPPMVTEDNSGRTQGTLVRVNASDVNAINHQAAHHGVVEDVPHGAPRRRYAGGERDQ